MQKCKNKKFIYTASSSCYGIPKNYPTKETEIISTKYPYALTKKIGEDLIVHWSSLFKIPFISLRLFNVYGTRSRTSGTYGAMFGVFLAQKISGKPFTIVGNGKQTRDFTYVSDIIDALMISAKSKFSNEIFNVGSSRTISINRIVELLEGEKIFIKKRPGEPDCTFADITKIRKKLGWYPKIGIEKGIKKLIKNIDYWNKAPVWTPEKIRQATKLWFKYLSDEK